MNKKSFKTALYSASQAADRWDCKELPVETACLEALLSMNWTPAQTPERDQMGLFFANVFLPPKRQPRRNAIFNPSRSIRHANSLFPIKTRTGARETVEFLCHKQIIAREVICPAIRVIL